MTVFKKTMPAAAPSSGPSVPTSSSTPEVEPSAVAGPDSGTPGAGSDSPNPAERLQDANLTGSPAGAGTPLAESGQTDRPFDPADRQDDDAPVTTGLPDFTRGA